MLIDLLENLYYKEIGTSRQAGELTTEEAKKIVDLVQEFDIFDSDYLYDLEEVKEEHRTLEQKQQSINYLFLVLQAEEGEQSELEQRLKEVIQILEDRKTEQNNVII